MSRLPVIKNAVFSALLLSVSIIVQAGSPGADDVASVHRALDAGEISPAAAARSYRLIIRRYRQDEEVASEALFAMGCVYEKLGMDDEAAGAYLEIVRNYPGTDWLMPSVDALFSLGEQILERGRQGVFVDDVGRARRIFSVLAELDLPTEKKAFLWYNKGASSLKMGNYVQAEFDFRRVLDEYPAEPWAENAYYGLGETYVGRVSAPSRDQTMTQRAIDHYESFLSKYPGSALRKEAIERLNELREKKSEHFYLIYTFYYRHGVEEGRALYAGLLAENFPGTSWAEMVRKHGAF